jgi:putative copper resistance protein D
MTLWFAAARAVHFGACLLIAGVWIFDRTMISAIVRPRAMDLARFWETVASRLMLVVLPAALISGAAWFALVVIDMSGLPPGQALVGSVLNLVWSHTRFGTVWQWRSGLWLAATLAACVCLMSSRQRRRSAVVWAAAILSAALLGSLAWAGHGLLGDSAWHLAADVLHLVVSAIWPTGLLFFGILLLHLRRTPTLEHWQIASLMTRRFSLMSLASVGLLAATGLVNAWYSLRSVGDLFISPYGRLLLAKIVLFSLMMVLGAFNGFRLKPRVVAAVASASEMPVGDAAQLQATVFAEIILGTVIVLIVGFLGMLPPPRA